VTLRFNREIIEVGAAENDARICGCRQKANVAENPRVEAHTLSVRFASYAGLEHYPHRYGSRLLAKISPACPYFSVTYTNTESLFLSQCVNNASFERLDVSLPQHNANPI
jgi:hypothetical protein